MRTAITQAMLRSLLAYDQNTGIFKWIASRGRACHGKIAGVRCAKSGYIKVRIHGRLYQAHRLVWLYMVGEWPSSAIDHINGVRDDNRWVNIRAATALQNQQNRSTENKNNKSSGLLGASLHRASGKWLAQISYKGKHTYIGLFSTMDGAHQAYLKAKAELHSFCPVPRS